MTTPCLICGGGGMRIVDREGGARYAVPCQCVVAQRGELLLRRAGIPPRENAGVRIGHIAARERRVVAV
jgi:hypothetical protein